jgi:hypothetical protein
MFAGAAVFPAHGFITLLPRHFGPTISEAGSHTKFAFTKACVSALKRTAIMPAALAFSASVLTQNTTSGLTPTTKKTRRWSNKQKIVIELCASGI